MYAHVTGYSRSSTARSPGWSGTRTSFLTGEDDSLWLDRLQTSSPGEEAQGSSVELTIDPAVQKAACDALGDQQRRRVALDPTTGAILAMVSKPSYDPNMLAVHDSAEVKATSEALINDKPQINTVDGEERFSVYGPTINRTINATYPPGSTFKLLTPAAAIEYDGITPDTPIPAPDAYRLPGTSTDRAELRRRDLRGLRGDDARGRTAISCNTAFAELGLTLGEDGMQQHVRGLRVHRVAGHPDVDLDGAYPASSAARTTTTRTPASHCPASARAACA